MPSQALGIISGLKTNVNPSLCYSAHKSFNANHNISTARLKHFRLKKKKNPKTHNISTEPQYFHSTVKKKKKKNPTKFTSTHLILYGTHQSLSGIFLWPHIPELLTSEVNNTKRVPTYASICTTLKNFTVVFENHPTTCVAYCLRMRVRTQTLIC